MLKPTVVFLIPIIILCQTCGTGREYSIDKLSPQGTYRIKIEVTPGNRAHLFQRPDEHCKIQYFKGRDEIGGYETNCRQDEHESSLAEGWEVVEWMAENVGRIGRDRSDQPFEDKLSVSNKTGEVIRKLGLGYGRFQSFEIFDLLPNETITFSASPEFKPDGSSSYFVSYAGNTPSRLVEGVVKAKERKSPKEGPLQLQITIDSNSFRK